MPAPMAAEITQSTSPKPSRMGPLRRRVGLYRLCARGQSRPDRSKWDWRKTYFQGTERRATSKAVICTSSKLTFSPSFSYPVGTSFTAVGTRGLCASGFLAETLMTTLIVGLPCSRKWINAAASIVGKARQRQVSDVLRYRLCLFVGLAEEHASKNLDKPPPINHNS